MLDQTSARPPDAAVLGHARRRRRRDHPALPEQPRPPRGRRRGRARRRQPTSSGRSPTSTASRSRPRSSRRGAARIVFCRTQHGADRLAKQLGQLGVTAVAIHGDRTQPQRDRALAAFSDGRAVAARRHRRRRPRHPRRRRRLRRALRPAGRPQGLRPPLGPHRPRRRHRLVVTMVITDEKRKDVIALAARSSCRSTSRGRRVAGHPGPGRVDDAPPTARSRRRRARTGGPPPQTRVREAPPAGPAAATPAVAGRAHRHGEVLRRPQGLRLHRRGRGSDVFVHATALERLRPPRARARPAGRLRPRGRPQRPGSEPYPSRLIR